MKMMAFVSVLAVAVAQSSIVPADAQTLISKQVELGDFGACLLKQARGQSTKLLGTTLGSSEERELAITLARGHNACIRGRVLTGQTGAIRGAVAQAVLFRDPVLLDRLAARPTAPAIRPEKADGRRFLIAYATCLTTAEPGKTAAFLHSGYGTAEERTGFLAYGDTLKACMPVGQEYQVDIPDLRNQIAAIAYQLAGSLEAK